MIRVNLLPRQAASRHGETWWQLSLTLAALLVLALVGARLHGVQSIQLAAQHAEQRQLEAELQALQPLLKQTARLKAEKAELERKASVIGGLRNVQRQPARLLAAISQSLPEQIWLDAVRDTDAGLEITGKSFDNEGIAAFMENLGTASGAPFSRVVLVESKAGTLHGRPIVAFTVSAQPAPPGDRGRAAGQAE